MKKCPKGKILIHNRCIKESTDWTTNESIVLYKSTDAETPEEVVELIGDIVGKEKPRFISFTNKPNYNHKEFGKYIVKFKPSFAQKNKIIEVFYDSEFMELHPDISMKVTGNENAEEYNASHQDEYDLDWETHLSDYEEEAEVLVKNPIKVSISDIEYVKPFDDAIKQIE